MVGMKAAAVLLVALGLVLAPAEAKFSEYLEKQKQFLTGNHLPRNVIPRYD